MNIRKYKNKSITTEILMMANDDIIIFLILFLFLFLFLFFFLFFKL